MPDVVSIVALSLTCFNGCVKGLIVLSKAKHYSRDVSDVRLQTELTLHALTTWAEEAGLLQDPPTLLMSANNAALVPDILSQLETLLLDLNQLKQKYGLYLQPTAEDVEPFDQDDQASSQPPSQRPRYTKMTDFAVFRKRKEPWKILKWVTLDDKRFDRLLEKAKSYISEMEKFLEQAKQEKMERQLEFCLRDAILNTNAQQDLGVFRKEYGTVPVKLAIAAAARVKQTRLRLGFPDSEPTLSTTSLSKSAGMQDSLITNDTSTSSKNMKLPMRQLTLPRAARAQTIRTLAYYDGRAVLLEWKNVNDMNDPTISARVNQVASFLQDLGPLFHSLQCRGYVKDRVEKRYGYIFDLPDELSQRSEFPQGSLTAQALPELISLRQMLDKSSVTSLNLRMSLAVAILEALLNLHTSGWLHKDFRSDNIVLIRTPRSNDAAAANDLSTYSVYLAGYVCSRVDSPGEMTEPLSSELEADLYRHPSLLSGVRRSYSKSLDIFSVGCTLLEIGLWASLRQVLEYHSKERHETTTAHLPERSLSDPTLARSNSIQLSHRDDDDGDDDDDGGTAGSLDLLRLKHELLLPDMTAQRPTLKLIATQDASSVNKRSMIMKSLESATGKLYTSVVEEFLAAGNTIRDTKVNEHEFALDLEMRARDAVWVILEAI